MATEQRFEGSSLEEVLAQVKDTFGSDADIISANKIRPSGVGAVFGRERFEVIAKPRERGAKRTDFDKASRHVDPVGQSQRERASGQQAAPSRGAASGGARGAGSGARGGGGSARGGGSAGGAGLRRGNLGAGSRDRGIDFEEDDVFTGVPKSAVDRAMNHVHKVMADMDKRSPQGQGSTAKSLMDLVDQMHDDQGEPPARRATNAPGKPSSTARSPRPDNANQDSNAASRGGLFGFGKTADSPSDQLPPRLASPWLDAAPSESTGFNPVRAFEGIASPPPSPSDYQPETFAEILDAAQYNDSTQEFTQSWAAIDPQSLIEDAEVIDQDHPEFTPLDTYDVYTRPKPGDERYIDADVYEDIPEDDAVLHSYYSESYDTDTNDELIHPQSVHVGQQLSFDEFMAQREAAQAAKKAEQAERIRERLPQIGPPDDLDEDFDQTVKDVHDSDGSMGDSNGHGSSYDDGYDEHSTGGSDATGNATDHDEDHGENSIDGSDATGNAAHDNSANASDATSGAVYDENSTSGPTHDNTHSQNDTGHAEENDSAHGNSTDGSSSTSGAVYDKNSTSGHSTDNPNANANDGQVHPHSNLGATPDPTSGSTQPVSNSTKDSLVNDDSNVPDANDLPSDEQALNELTAQELSSTVIPDDLATLYADGDNQQANANTDANANTNSDDNDDANNSSDDAANHAVHTDESDQADGSGEAPCVADQIDETLSFALQGMSSFDDPVDDFVQPSGAADINEAVTGFEDLELEDGWVPTHDDMGSKRSRLNPNHIHGEEEVEADRMVRLIEWLATNDLDRAAIAKALEGLPTLEELPKTHGVVMAIVGEGFKTLPLARRIAAELSLDPADVLLASSRRGHASVPDNARLANTVEAHMERRSWRRSTTPTIVAIDTSFALSRVAQQWANDMLEALEPHQVIGLIDAGRKIDDIARWITLIGGVDAIALAGIDETATPQAVLELGLPVARLGSQVATPSSWADLLHHQKKK